MPSPLDNVTSGDEAANLKKLSVSVPRLKHESLLLSHSRATRRQNNEVGDRDGLAVYAWRCRQIYDIRSYHRLLGRRGELETLVATLFAVGCV